MESLFKKKKKFSLSPLLVFSTLLTTSFLKYRKYIAPIHRAFTVAFLYSGMKGKLLLTFWKPKCQHSKPHSCQHNCWCFTSHKHLLNNPRKIFGTDCHRILQPIAVNCVTNIKLSCILRGPCKPQQPAWVTRATYSYIHSNPFSPFDRTAQQEGKES